MQIVPTTADDRPDKQTYVIQVPKDQIYRVPPPHNAKLAEKYRNPDNTESEKRRKQGLIWCGSILFFIVFLITTITCVNKYTLRPKLPIFSIRGINYGKISSKKTGFKVSLQIINPNGNNDIEFKDGNATLVYQEEQEIGTGKFDPPSGGNQKRGKTTVVDILLNSIDPDDLPDELLRKPTAKKKKGKKSDDEDDEDEGLPLKMNLDTTVKLKTWQWTKSVDITVECDIEADTLAKGSSILSQDCAIDDSGR